MNKLLVAILAFASISIGQTAFAADSASAATVNGKPIKQVWVDYITKDAIARGQKPGDNLRAAIINELVGSELAYQEAVKQGLDKSQDYQVSSELSNRKILVNMYLQDFMKKNPVTDAEIKAKYDDLKKELGDKEYSAKHILVKTEAEAKDIIAQLGKGGDFAKIAKEKSLDPGSKDKGGDLGWFSPAAMVKPFSDAVVGLKKDAITTTPVQTQFGWHVIKLVDSRAAQVPPYDKVKDGLERNIQQAKLEKMMLGLKDKSKIDVPGITDKPADKADKK